MSTKSTHRCEVVEVIKKPHPTADFLSLVAIGGYQVVVQTAAWPAGQLGVYIPPDNLVDTKRPEFNWLGNGEMYKVSVKRLRGFPSQGILVPAPAGAKVGDDLAEALGVVHYVPPVEQESGADNVASPDGTIPTYDVESFNGRGPEPTESELVRLVYATLFVPGERVICTEKIHGASARYMFAEGQLWIGSRTNWKGPGAKDRQWHRAAENTPQIEKYCRQHPGHVLFGECYGTVKGMKYGRDKVGPGFVCFDIWDKTHWLDWAEFVTSIAIASLPIPPVLYDGPYDEAKVRAVVDGPSILAKNQGADHIREGIVIKPVVERYDPQLGRVHLKLVSEAYHKRGQKEDARETQAVA